MVNDAERSGKLGPGGVIVEGTAGKVGIGIALVANARGYRSVIVMPDTQSQEKKDMLRSCGADLRLVPAVPYSDPGHYARYSGQLAEELGAFWANQFDNVANREGHYRTTGPEIWEQTGGKIDGFTCAVGSGGTLGGVARALKERNPAVTIALSDPMGAALYNWFTKGELTTEGDSITEGIGQVRVTKNLEGTPIDMAYQITDEEALPVLFDLIEHEGLVLGGSSAINIVGAMRLARDLGPGETIVTILADGGQRYQSKLFNPEFLRKKNLPTPLDGLATAIGLHISAGWRYLQRLMSVAMASSRPCPVFPLTTDMSISSGFRRYRPGAGFGRIALRLQLPGGADDSA